MSHLFSAVHFSSKLKIPVYLLSSVLLVLLSALCFLGRLDIAEVAQAYFFMTEDTPLKYYHYLYMLMTAGQYAFILIAVLWSKGKLRENLFMLFILGIFYITLQTDRERITQDVMTQTYPSKTVIQTIRV